MILLLGVSTFKSKDKTRDFYKVHLAKSGLSGVKGLSVDSPFCQKSCFDQYKEEDSGKEIEAEFGYDENGYLSIKGYKIIKKGGN